MKNYEQYDMNEIFQRKFVQIFIMQLVQLFFTFKKKLVNILRMKFLLIKFKKKKFKKSRLLS